MTVLKWSITTQERNALVESHLGCIWWTINKNRRLISAVGLDDEDVFQQLAIRMIRAVENYDPDKGKDLEQHMHIYASPSSASPPNASPTQWVAFGSEKTSCPTKKPRHRRGFVSNRKFLSWCG